MSTDYWTTLVIAGEVMLVSLVVCAYLLWLLMRARRQIDRQRDQLQLLAKRQACDFLMREIAHTREIGRRSRLQDDGFRLLSELRLHWLNAEHQSLVEEGGVKSDLTTLERASRPMLARLDEKRSSASLRTRPSKGSAAVPSADTDSAALLSQARAVIALQKEIIGKLKDQLAVAPISDVAGRATDGGDQFSSTLEQVNDNTASQLASVAKLEKELTAAKSSYRRASDELARLQAADRGSREGLGEVGSGILIVSRDKASINPDSARNLLDDMEAAHSESIKELKLMRVTNARQRELILQLEMELSSLRAGSVEQAASLALLENLTAQLREYETCTATLELETENLRSKIQTLTLIIEEAEKTGDVDMVGHLERQISGGVDLQRQHGRQILANQRLAKLALSGSVERAAPDLTAWLTELGLSAVVLIRAADKQYWLTSEGVVIDNQIKQLLQSVVPSAETSWMNVRNGSVFTGATLRLFIEDVDRDASFTALKEYLSPQLHILNSLLHLFDQVSHDPTELANAKSMLDQARMQIISIDNQHHYLLEENARVGNKLHAELQQYYGSLALTDIQRECIEGMLEDFKSEIHLLSRAAKAIHHSLQLASRGLVGQ